MEEDAGELIVVGVDNSCWVPPGSDIFLDLCKAIELYCRAKFNENPDTVVGLYTMGSFGSGHFVYPTQKIEELVDKIPRINPGCGHVDLIGMFSFGCMPLSRYSLSCQQYQNKKKRVVLFIGGLTNLSLLCAEEAAVAFRAEGIAIDVIDFYTGGPPKCPISNYPYGSSELKALIKWCNLYDNGKHRFVHVGSRSICDALSQSGLIKIKKSEEQKVKRKVGVEESSAAWGSKRRAVEA